MSFLKPKPFSDSEVCKCGKSLNDLAIGKVSCAECEKEAFDKIQTLPVFKHFKNSFFYFINFNFLLAFGAIVIGIGMFFKKVFK